MTHPGADDEQPDASIVRRIVAGDVEAFGLLVDRHTPRIRRLVARSVPRSAVAEVAHDAFVAAYLSLPSYVASHPFEAWLVRIALRTCADYWRGRARDDRTSAELSELAIDPACADDRELCEWALAHLEREDREALTLVFFEGLSVKQCAELLSWSESKVKVRTHRARARLRQLLQRFLGEREARS